MGSPKAFVCAGEHPMSSMPSPAALPVSVHVIRNGSNYATLLPGFSMQIKLRCRNRNYLVQP